MTEITIKVEFKIGQIVYFKVDTVDQQPWMIRSYKVTAKDVLYVVTTALDESIAYGFELTEEKPID